MLDQFPADLQLIPGGGRNLLALSLFAAFISPMYTFERGFGTSRGSGTQHPLNAILTGKKSRGVFVSIWCLLKASASDAIEVAGVWIRPDCG